jgi:hypothetical protein
MRWLLARCSFFPLLSVQTLYDDDSVYTRRLRALKAFRGTKAFRCIKAFRDSKANPMSSLAHNWYINTHPHMHKAEAGERVRLSIF